MARDTAARLGRAVTSLPGILLCLAAVWGVLVCARLTPSFEMYPDTSIYLGVARSLAQGQGYTIDGRFSQVYPPGFPALMSVVGSPSRGSYLPERLVVALMGLGALLGCAWLLSQRYRGWRLLVLLLLLALSPTFVRMAGCLLSDVPFFCLAALFLAAANRYWRSPRASWRMGVLAAVSLVAATLMRSVGIAFYVAVAAWLVRPSLWRRDARRCALFAALFLLVACPPALGWRLLVRSRTNSSLDSYADVVETYALGGRSLLSAEGLRRLVQVESRSLPGQLTFASDLLSPLRSRSDYFLLETLLLLLVLAGLVRRLRRPEPVDYCFCAYAGLVLVWPFLQGTRLWLPILPLMFGYISDAVDGLGRLAEAYPRLGRVPVLGAADRVAGRLRRPVLVVGGVVLLVLMAPQAKRTAGRTSDWSAEAIRNVVLSRDREAVARFLVERREEPIRLAYAHYLEVVPALGESRATVVAVPFSARSRPAEALRAIQRNGLTHLAVGGVLRRGADLLEGAVNACDRLIEAEPGRFRLVEATRHARIYQILPPPPESPPPAGS